MGYSSQSLENQLFKTWLGVSRSQALQLVAPKEPLWKISKWKQELGASILEDVSHIELALRNLLDAALGGRLARIKALRNRVAHQRRILHRNLQDDFDLVILVATDIDHRLADFIRDNSRTPEILIRITQAKSFSKPREPH